MCAPQICLSLFSFRPIASKQLISLTTIVTFTWLGGAEVTHPLLVQEVPGTITCSGKAFYVWLFLGFFVFFNGTKTHYMWQHLFCTVNLFVFQDFCDRLSKYKDTGLESLRITITWDFCYTIIFMKYFDDLNSHTVTIIYEISW